MSRVDICRYSGFTFVLSKIGHLVRDISYNIAFRRFVQHITITSNNCKLQNIICSGKSKLCMPLFVKQLSALKLKSNTTCILLVAITPVRTDFQKSIFGCEFWPSRILPSAAHILSLSTPLGWNVSLFSLYGQHFPRARHLLFILILGTRLDSVAGKVPGFPCLYIRLIIGTIGKTRQSVAVQREGVTLNWPFKVCQGQI